MIFIGTIVKNYESHFSIFESFICKMIQTIPDVTICIYEDNSSDNTPSLLEGLRNTYHKNVHILCDKFIWSSSIMTWDNKPCRIEQIERARNRLMEFLQLNGMGANENDICIIVDSDFPCLPDIERLSYWATHFPEDVDALFANGKENNGIYYDMFAYRDLQFPFDLELFGENQMGYYVTRMKKETRSYDISYSSKRTPVLSAFSGIGIYRVSSIKNARYSFLPTKTVDDFYRSFIESYPDHDSTKRMKELQPAPHTENNLSGSRRFGENGLFYHNCQGYSAPVICEHIPFHFEMIKNGHGRLFIEPSLRYTK
jgi:hypothetical protein